jgi:type IV pilus assembly protein PilO
LADLSLSKLPPRTQIAVFVLLALAGAGAYYYFYELPRQEAIAAKTSELAAVRARIDKAVATARQLGDFQKQVGELEARLESLRPILPQEKDVADLLRRIQMLATQSNLTIRGFKPEAITTRELHAEWPIGLELEGTYHNLGLFLDRVSKFPRIINIGAINIASREPPAPSATIDVSCTATTFVLLETPTGTAKPANPATRVSE